MSQTPVTTPPSSGPTPLAALKALADRVRPDGLCLMLLGEDGSILYHDPAAGGMFDRYVLPLLIYPDAPSDTAGVAADTAVAVAVSSPSAQPAIPSEPKSSIGVWEPAPGVIVAAFPWMERRNLIGLLAIAGRAPSFSDPDPVHAACTRLGVDPDWLIQQAATLRVHDAASIRRHAQLLMAMARDQVRLRVLETEVDNISAQLSSTYEELSLVYQLSSGMQVNRRAGDFFRQACQDLLEVVNVRGMGVSFRPAEDLPETPVLYGSMALPPGAVQRLAGELSAVFAERSQPLLVNDLKTHVQCNWLAGSATNLLAVPLRRQHQLLGVLFAVDKIDGDFDSVDIKLLSSIASELAIYLQNAMLFEDVHGLMMGMLHSLTSAVDAKDAYTCGHSERVALLARLLAEKAGLGDAEIDRVYMAGLLHDVGKIGVPEAVLQKTGRLTADEFDLMKKHPEIGARILADVRQVRDIVPGVLHHHERYDGKGYPAGLAGEDIPLMGRIICLADCFDAMTSNRTYRRALPLEVAMTEIRRCGGTQFDPGLTEAFLRIGIDAFRDILTNHRQAARSIAAVNEVARAA